MDELQFVEIQAYFNIDYRIRRLKKRIPMIREIFYNRTFSTRTESDGLEIYTVGERMDDSVSKLVDVLTDLERSIEILKKRKKYLKDYLNTLPPDDRQYLTNKYSQKKIPANYGELDQQLHEEILEINEAINYMQGYPQDIRPVEVDNSSIDDEFSFMLDVLGV